MKKDTNERMMSSRQKLVQMQYYWNNLAHTATDDMKKKSMKMRFGIKNIKLDKKGGKLISFDEHVEIDEAVGKFMSGEVGIKGKRVKVEVEVTGVDNKKRIYHAKVLSPKEHFGTDLNIPARVMHRGTWLKTKIGKALEGVDWTKFDTPFGDRHGKKFDSWDEWEKVEKDREKLEKSQNGKKQMNDILMPRSPKNRNKTFEQFIKEVKGGTAVFTFGRFNPPTIGHEKLLKVLASTATKNDADKFIYLSQSQDAKKNPLSASQKLMFMKLMFPKHRRDFPTTSARTAIEALVELYEQQKYSKVIMIVGSDRVREFDAFLNKYNDVKSKHGYYNFENIDVISAGERDPDAEGASGMSASKMRAAVQEGNYDLFKMGVPAGVSEKNCHILYNAVAKGMNINIKEGMEYTTEDMEEINSLIGEIDILCKEDRAIPILREDQICEFLFLKEVVDEGDLEKVKYWTEASKGLSPAQRRKMSIRMRIQAKKPGFIKKRLRALKRAATKAVIAQRSRKAAIKMVVKKFFPKLRTKKKSELSMSDRAKISDIVKSKSKIITRFAKKLLIKTRKKDVERRRAMSGKQDKAGVKGES